MTNGSEQAAPRSPTRRPHRWRGVAQRSAALAAVLAAVAACGPGEGAPCQVGDRNVPSGELYAPPDGCETFVCEDGQFVIESEDHEVREGDLVLETQAAVDALACVFEIDGSLDIRGQVFDLGPLQHVEAIHGALRITGSRVTSLYGLGPLGEVGGHIVLADNPDLVELGFSRTLAAYGDLVVRNNDALPSLAGIGFAAECQLCEPEAPATPPPREGTWRATGGELPPADEPSQPEANFHGSIEISDNDRLTNLDGLRNLRFAWADFRVRDNRSLERLDLRLEDVRGTLEIAGNESLPLDVVEALLADVLVGGETVVCGNGEQPPCE